MSFDYTCDRGREIVRQLDPYVVSDDSDTSTPTTVATHNGLFHIDEVMACTLLWLAGKGSHIRRTRNAELLGKAAIVVDVGLVYDHAAMRYDHHQKGFAETLIEEGCTTMLSAAGLVYRHYGKQALARVIDDPAIVDQIYGHVYKQLIEYIDCMDNGIEPYEGGRRKVRISGTLHDRVRRLYPGDKATPEAVSDAFKDAMRIALTEFVSLVSRERDSWLKSYPEVLKAVKARFDTHPSGEVIFIPKGVYVGEYIYEVERTEKVDRPILYLVSPAVDGKSHNIIAVKVEGQVFESRKKLPESYGGLKQDELRATSGVEDAVFVHKNGFIGGAETIHGAMKLAGYVMPVSCDNL